MVRRAAAIAVSASGGTQRRSTRQRPRSIRATTAGWPVRSGAAYASGTATLGGYFPGVDTFLGLQIAAQEITDELARRGFCRGIGPGRSLSQWWRWARNRPVD